MSRLSHPMQEREEDTMKIMESALFELYEDITGARTQTHPPDYRAAALAPILLGMYPMRTGQSGIWGEKGQIGGAVFGALMDPFSTGPKIGSLIYEMLNMPLNPASAEERASILTDVNGVLAETIGHHSNGQEVLLGNHNSIACGQMSTDGVIELQPKSLCSSLALLCGGGAQTPDMFVRDTAALVKYQSRMGGGNGTVAYLNGRSSGDLWGYAILFTMAVLAALILFQRKKKERVDAQGNQGNLHRNDCTDRAIAFLSNELMKTQAQLLEDRQNKDTEIARLEGVLKGMSGDLIIAHENAFQEHVKLFEVKEQLDTVVGAVAAKVDDIESRLGEVVHYLKATEQARDLRQLNAYAYSKEEAVQRNRLQNKQKEMEQRVEELSGMLLPDHSSTTGRCNVSNIVTKVGQMIGERKTEKYIRDHIDTICMNLPPDRFFDFVQEMLNQNKLYYKNRHWKAEAATAILAHSKNLNDRKTAGHAEYLSEKKVRSTPPGGYMKIFQDMLLSPYKKQFERATSSHDGYTGPSERATSSHDGYTRPSVQAASSHDGPESNPNQPDLSPQVRKHIVAGRAPPPGRASQPSGPPAPRSMTAMTTPQLRQELRDRGSELPPNWTSMSKQDRISLLEIARAKRTG